jgi:quinol monooxygenase YgiN
MTTQFSISNNLKALLAVPLVTVVFFFSFTSPSQKQTVFEMKNSVKTLIYHKVADFTTWKATFDGAKPLRTTAGELNYEIGTLRHDPSIVYVLSEWTSVEAFQAFMAKPELAEAMKKAGVLEPPHTAVFLEKEKTATIGKKVNTLIFHPVESFENWKTTFASAKDFRTAAGELSYEIGTFHNAPNIVYVLNEWTSVEAFQAFMAKPELAEAMKKAGVMEPPKMFIFDKKATGN